MAATASQWSRPLVNVYEVKSAWCNLQCKKLCDPCWALQRWASLNGALYKSIYLYLYHGRLVCVQSVAFTVGGESDRHWGGSTTTRRDGCHSRTDGGCQQNSPQQPVCRPHSSMYCVVHVGAEPERFLLFLKVIYDSRLFGANAICAAPVLCAALNLNSSASQSLVLR